MEARPTFQEQQTPPMNVTSRRRFRVRPRWLLAVLAAATVIAVGLAGVGVGGESGTFAYDGVLDAVGFGGETSGTSVASNLPPATYTVSKGTLTQTESVSGILSYGEPKPLIAQGSAGVVTWMAPAGSTVKLGEPVYTVNGVPVVLIHGTIPPYRVLEQGVVGPDVQQLEASLQALGYTNVTVDETYDYLTVEAVWAWQGSLGLLQTGYVTPDQIAVAEGDIRVALQGLAVGSHLGGSEGQTVLTYSGTTRYVSIPLDVSLQHLVEVGNTATVTLPDGTTVSGKVSFVDTVAQTIEDKQIIPVHVSIKDQKKLGTLDAAPVTIALKTGEEKDVLVVPVSALVALSDGGYGLQVVEGSQVSYVAVDTGMFANGMVEVSGAGIDEGTVVGVAA